MLLTLDPRRPSVFADHISSYFNKNPEAVHFLMFLFSDRSTPEGFQYADIFSVNTYRFTKAVSHAVQTPERTDSLFCKI